MGKNGNFYNNYTAYKRTREGALMSEYINYVAPHCYAAFILTLYDKYKWEPDEIAECITASDELWERSQKEGWDIKANCYECTGINVSHISDTGRVEYEDWFRPLTMAQRAERVRKEVLNGKSV